MIQIMKIFRTCIAVFAISMSSYCVADQRPIPLEFSGVGVESCATYVLALNENRPTAAIKMDGKTYFTEAATYTQWVVGYVNAIRWMASTTETFSNGKKFKVRPLPADVNAIALSIKKHCEANPDLTIMGAAVDYVNGHTK